MLRTYKEIRIVQLAKQLKIGNGLWYVNTRFGATNFDYKSNETTEYTIENMKLKPYSATTPER